MRKGGVLLLLSASPREALAGDERPWRLMRAATSEKMTPEVRLALVADDFDF